MWNCGWITSIAARLALAIAALVAMANEWKNSVQHVAVAYLVFAVCILALDCGSRCRESKKEAKPRHRTRLLHSAIYALFGSLALVYHGHWPMSALLFLDIGISVFARCRDKTTHSAVIPSGV